MELRRRFARSRLMLRLGLSALAAVVMVSGVAVILTAVPQVAKADEPTPGIEPDIEVTLGDEGQKSFSKRLVGSPDGQVAGATVPDDCRDDPAFGLTCAAVRIKLTIPGTENTEEDFADVGAALEVTTSWAETTSTPITNVPDVDTYLFYNPENEYDSQAVGGAGGEEPETIVITPEQSEFDLVVKAFAGSIDAFKVTVSFADAGAPPKIPKEPLEKINPDFVLTADAPPVVKTFEVVTASELRRNYPADCRHPETASFCDVYRFKLNRSKAKGARNFVVIQLEWDGIPLPEPMLAVTALSFGYLPEIDMFVYDQPEVNLASGVIGGTGFGIPEKVQFTARQDEYDLVVMSQGPTTGYTIKAFMTDELFDAPFEFIEEGTTDVESSAPGLFGPFGTSPLNDLGQVADALGLSPIDTDPQIAGIGFGASERFDAAAAGLGRSTRAVAVGDPPSGWMLLLALVVFPGTLAAAAAIVLRRRRNVLF